MKLSVVAAKQQFPKLNTHSQRDLIGDKALQISFQSPSSLLVNISTVTNRDGILTTRIHLNRLCRVPSLMLQFCHQTCNRDGNEDARRFICMLACTPPRVLCCHSRVAAEHGALQYLRELHLCGVTALMHHFC